MNKLEKLKTLSKKLNDLRRVSQRTQKETAEILGITPSGYASWEQGRTEPSLFFVLKICEIYGISPNELLDWNIAD
ncbi:MAG: helix-turn-helix domain-containing protein [Clostridiaceae bacterium]|jgi:transcriptional regulator with XRE-family HTH domain|nr:helix-turn-helix domain-containing protein [Clostridiaceae bacterium]